MRAVGARKSTGRGQRGENGGDALHAGAKPHVVVPFVLDLEWLHATRDRMLRKLVEPGRPRRIDRIVRLEVAADPVQELRPAVFLGHFDGVMQADDANALLGQGIDFLLMRRAPCGRHRRRNT